MKARRPSLWRWVNGLTGLAIRLNWVIMESFGVVDRGGKEMRPAGYQLMYLELDDYDQLESMHGGGTYRWKVSGAWLFCGTRVPVTALFENLEDGATIDDFVEWFPGCRSRAGGRRLGVRRTESRHEVTGERPCASLFDQGTPVPLRQSLAAHTVSTAFEMGWSMLANGNLLAAAGTNFRSVSHDRQEPPLSTKPIGT